MVSLALAALLTDQIMAHLMKFSPKYKLLKYQLSPDFGNIEEKEERMKKLLDEANEKYDPLDDKPHAHADILNDLACKKEAPTGEALLQILCKFEQRLNRLDALDVHNAEGGPFPDRENRYDEGAAFMDYYDQKYFSEPKK